MAESGLKYDKIEGVDVGVIHREESYVHTLMRGRGVYMPLEEKFLFVENKPRGPKSRMLGTTNHAKYRVRPDGTYGISLIFDPKEKFMPETLIAEVRECHKAIVKHYKNTQK